MTETFEVQLTPTGPFRQPPRAPGLFGHLAWALRYRDGEAALRRWLMTFQEQPPFLLSSAYPTGYLPRPLLPPKLVADTRLRKALKSVKYVPFKVFTDMLSHGETALERWVREDAPQAVPGWTAAGRTRVTIDRASGGALEGALYTEEAVWYSAPQGERLSIYIRSSAAAAEDVVDLLRLVGRTGYGGRASTGMGGFTVLGHQKIALPEAESANYAVSLSPVLPREAMTGWWRLEPYWGRLGGHFAAEAKPFKRPHLRVLEGSTLDLGTPGGLLDLTPEPAPEPGVTVWEYLYAFPLGIHVKEKL